MAAQQTGAEWFGTRLEIVDGRPSAITLGRRFPLGSLSHFQQSMESRLEVMSNRNVDIQVLSLLPPLYRYDLAPSLGVAAAEHVNDEIAAITRRWPTRFRGLATLPLQDPAAAVRELERAVSILGLDGAAVGTNVRGANWDHPTLFPVLEAAARLRALLFVHPESVRPREPLAHFYLGNLIGNPFETTVAVASIIFSGVLDRLPDLRLCFAHGGGYACFGIGRMDHGYSVRDEPRVGGARLIPTDYLRTMYFDSLTHSHQALRYIVEAVGAEHVVMGSDYPADMGSVDPVAFVETCAGLSQNDREAILGGNLERLLRIPPAVLLE